MTENNNPESTKNASDDAEDQGKDEIQEIAVDKNRRLPLFGCSSLLILATLIVICVCGVQSLVGCIQSHLDGSDTTVNSPKNMENGKSGASTEPNETKGTPTVFVTPLRQENSIRQSRLRKDIASGKKDVRVITTGELEDGSPYESADETKLPYVAYPADAQGEYHVDTIRTADGRLSFDMPYGFWLVSDASSDNPDIKTFIRNEELGVTIGIGRGTSGETPEQMVERWATNSSAFAHTGTRYSRTSKGGHASGLVWLFAFDDVSGQRHLVTEVPDGSKVYVDVTTDPWPGYERKANQRAHVARWIHEFINSVQLCDEPPADKA